MTRLVKPSDFSWPPRKDSGLGYVTTVDHHHFTMKVFAGEDCDEEEQPKFSWEGCEDAQSATCNLLPHSVRSFRLEQTVAEDLGEYHIAVERGAGTQGKQASILSIFVGAFALGIVAIT